MPSLKIKVLALFEAAQPSIGSREIFQIHGLCQLQSFFLDDGTGEGNIPLNNCLDPLSEGDFELLKGTAFEGVSVRVIVLFVKLSDLCLVAYELGQSARGYIVHAAQLCTR